MNARERIYAGADRILQSIQTLSETEGKSALTLAIMSVIATTSDSLEDRMRQIETLHLILQTNLEDEAATPARVLQ